MISKEAFSHVIINSPRLASKQLVLDNGHHYARWYINMIILYSKYGRGLTYRQLCEVDTDITRIAADEVYEGRYTYYKALMQSPHAKRTGILFTHL